MKTEEICYDGLQSAKPQFVSQQVKQQWPLQRDGLHRGVQRGWPRRGEQSAGNVQNSGFTGAHVVENQGNLTFVLLHRTAPRKCVGNTRLMSSVKLLRAVRNTFVLFIIGRPCKGIFILFGIQEWFGELAEG